MVHGYARSKSRARVTNELIGDCWEECAEACEMCCEEACGCCGITAWGIFLTVFASMLMCCCWTKQTGVIGVLLWIVVVIGDIIFVPAIVMAMGGACVCVYVCVVDVKRSAPPPELSCRRKRVVRRGGTPSAAAPERPKQQRVLRGHAERFCASLRLDGCRRWRGGESATRCASSGLLASRGCTTLPHRYHASHTHTHTHTYSVSSRNHSPTLHNIPPHPLQMQRARRTGRLRS